MKGTTEDSYNKGALNTIDLSAMSVKEEFKPYKEAIYLGRNWPDRNRIWDYMYFVFWRANIKRYPWYVRIFIQKKLDMRAVDFANYFRKADQLTFYWNLTSKSYEELVRLTKPQWFNGYPSMDSKSPRKPAKRPDISFVDDLDNDLDKIDNSN